MCQKTGRAATGSWDRGEGGEVMILNTMKVVVVYHVIVTSTGNDRFRGTTQHINICLSHLPQQLHVH